MWKNPKIVTRSFLPPMIERLIDERFQEKPFPRIQGTTIDAAHQIVTLLYESCRAAYQEAPTAVSVQRRLERELAEVAGLIEHQSQWSLVVDIWHVSDDLKMFINPLASCWQEFSLRVARALHFLIGSESRFLVGARHNQAAWVAYAAPKTADLAALAYKFLIDSDIKYLDAGDLSLIPRADEWVTTDSLQFPRVPNCSAKIAEILERAYYNQRYILHPEGAYVKTRGAYGVESLVLKVKKSLFDPNYVDFIGFFKTEKGGFVSGLSGLTATSGRQDCYLYDDQGFAFLLMAQIYHDLVTGIEVTSRPLQKNDAEELLKRPTELLESEYVPIPRVVHRKQLEFRTPASNPRSMQPHRVSGHRRKANMTDQQKDAIRELEEEIGIDILRWIPEGYTFVRPHVSPAGDSQIIQNLPRFIRRRIQGDIQKLLSDPEP